MPRVWGRRLRSSGPLCGRRGSLTAPNGFLKTSGISAPAARVHDAEGVPADGEPSATNQRPDLYT